MDVSIRYGDEQIKFNLHEELKIDENGINREIMEQPSYYGFLTLLQNKLQRVKDDKELELNKLKASLFIKYKNSGEGSRPLSNDLAESKVLLNKKYRKALEDYNKSKTDLSTIESCVRAFHQRADLIRSISANVRSEKSNY